MDGVLPQQCTPTPINNLVKWTALNEEYSHLDIPMALANDLRKDLWVVSLNCGGLTAALERNRIDKAKIFMIAWQFLRCGTDAMYILDT